MGELIVPGTLGILTDVAGLLVILVTTIPQMRDLGIFGAFWVAAIVVTVEILHPVLICFLPAPKDFHHYTPVLMTRFVGCVADVVTHPRGRWLVAGAFAAIFLVVGLCDVPLVDDRRGAARHSAVLAGSPVQRRDRRDRREVRRRRRAGDLRRGRSRRVRGRVRGASQDAGPRARAAREDRRGRGDLAGAAGARGEPRVPLRRAEAGDHSRVGARAADLPALQQPAGRAHVDRHERRPRLDAHGDLSRPQGRDDPARGGGLRGVHRRGIRWARSRSGSTENHAAPGPRLVAARAREGLRLLHDRPAPAGSRAHAARAAQGGRRVRSVRGEDRRARRRAAVARGVP